MVTNKNITKETKIPPSYIKYGRLKHPPPIAETVIFNIPLISLSPLIPQYAFFSPRNRG